MTKSQNRKITRIQDADPCIFTRDYGVPLRIPCRYAVAGAVGSPPPPIDALLTRLGARAVFEGQTRFCKKSYVLRLEY